MATLKFDRQPQLLQQYSNIQWNINDPAVRKNLRTALPQRQNTNPFFIRNNPHPSRVRHIKGLLDHPICTVMDSGYRDGAPNIHNEVLVNAYRKNAETTKRREAFVPGIGIVNIQPTWVEQLQSLTRKIDKMNANTVAGQQENKQNRPASRPISRQASRTSNPRLFEKRQMEDEFVRKSCSREANVKFEDAFARKTFSRDGHAKENDVAISQWHGCLPGNVVLEENEANVAQLLSQILKTDSLDVIRHWLLEAPEKEKEVVLEMIRAVSNSNLEFREVMNKLTRYQGGEDAAALRSEYEKMRDMKDIKGYTKSSPVNSPRGLSRGKEDSYLLDVIKENLEADMNVSRLSSRSQKKSKEIMLPNITRDDHEIEVLRSRLASRSSVNVFPAKSSRCSPR